MTKNRRYINEQIIEQAVSILNDNRDCIFEPIEGDELLEEYSLMRKYALELQKRNEDLMEENEQLKQQLSQAKANHKNTQKISLLEENRLLRKAAENLEDTDCLEGLKE